MRLDETVTWQGRTYVLRGLDPFGVDDRRCYLEDVETHRLVEAPFAEVSGEPARDDLVSDLLPWLRRRRD